MAKCNQLTTLVFKGLILTGVSFGNVPRSTLRQYTQRFDQNPTATETYDNHRNRCQDATEQFITVQHNINWIILTLSARVPKCQKLKMAGYTSMALNPSNSSNLEQLALKGLILPTRILHILCYMYITLMLLVPVDLNYTLYYKYGQLSIVTLMICLSLR